MGLVDTFEKRLARPFVMFLLGLAGIAVAYYGLREKEPALVYDVVSETNVLDVRRPVPDLKILFEGLDVNEQGLGLRLINLRVRNTGDTHILESHYDRVEPWGVTVADGRVADVRLSDSNSPYLTRRLQLQQLDSSTIAFTKPIFEKGRYFSLELLVLHAKNTQPSLTPLGKIAGVDSIPVTYSWRAAIEPSFLARTFTGPPAVQLARLLAYFFATIFFTGVIAALSHVKDRISYRFKRRQRERRALGLQRAIPKGWSHADLLMRFYIGGGRSKLKQLYAALTDEERLNEALELRAAPPGHGITKGPPPAVIFGVRPVPLAAKSLAKVVDAGIVDPSDSENPLRSPDFVDELREFLQILGGEDNTPG